MELLFRCLMSFVLPCFEYCWRSSADVYLHLLDCIVRQASFLMVICPVMFGIGEMWLDFVCMVLDRADPPIKLFLPELFVTRGSTRFSLNWLAHTFEEVRCRTNLFSHSFIPSMVVLCNIVWWVICLLPVIWRVSNLSFKSMVALCNSLVSDLFAAGDLASFKSKVNNLLSRWPSFMCPSLFLFSM